jgi:hypothetical protein
MSQWVVKISDIDQNTFDLSAKNPNAPIEPPLRHTQEILAEMKILDTESAERQTQPNPAHSADWFYLNSCPD